MQIEVGSSSPTVRRWYERVGPGLITACVVIGPGSILTSSRVGAAYGYHMSWVVVMSVCFMLVYMTLGAKLGVVSDQSIGDLVSERAGRWLAALIGVGVFFISAAFQFGNNLGVLSAFKEYEVISSAFRTCSWITLSFCLMCSRLSSCLCFTISIDSSSG